MINSLKTAGLFFILISALSFSVSADECTNMQLQPTNTVYNFTSGYTVNPSVVVKANTNPGGCNFFLTVSYGGGGSFANRRLFFAGNPWPVRITKDSAGTNHLKTLAQATSNNDIVPGVLPAFSGSDTQVTVNFWAELLNVYASRPAGYYADSFVVSLYKGTLASNSLQGTFNLTLGVNAVKTVDISIVPTGGSFNLADTTEVLNFGQLLQGTTRSADVILKYNAGYILKASSLNNSRLKHATLNSYVPYTITFAGSTVNLTNSAVTPVTINQGTGTSPANGTIYNTVVTIGNFPSNQSNGSYADTITLTVQSP